MANAELEQESSDSQAKPQAIDEAKTSERTFSKMRRELKEEEAAAASTAIQLMLLDRVEQLGAEIRELKPFREKYHEADKGRDVLKEKLKIRIASDLIFGICLSVGSLLLGFARPLWETPPFGVLMLVIGAFLIASAIGFKLTGFFKQ